MNSALARVLNTILGDWVENLNSDQLNLSLFSGQILLENLSLKQDAFKNLGFPFQITSGFFGKLFVKIPWTSLKSSPVQVEIEDVFALIKPRPSSDWNEALELQNIMRSKQLILDNFEAMNPDKNYLKTDEGWIDKLVYSIIINIQVSIKNLYIRFEDSVSSFEPFAFGFILNELTAISCNQNWEPAFLTDRKASFKLVSVKGLSVFFDFESGILNCSEQEKSLEKFARDELSYSIPHKFLIDPINTKIELIFGLDSENHESPLFSLSLDQDDLKLGLYGNQMTHFLKLIDYMLLYDTFIDGIRSHIEERKFKKSESRNYKETYALFRSKNFSQTKTDKKDAEQLRKILCDMEKGIKLENIKKYRKRVIQESELVKQEEEKRKEINELENDKSSFGFSTIKGWFGAKNEPDTKKKAKKIEAEKELKYILEQKKKLKNDNKNKKIVEESPSWVKIILVFSIRRISAHISNNNQPLIYGEIDDFMVNLGIRPTSVFIFVKFDNYLLHDNIAKSVCYPYVLQGGAVSIEIDTYPEKSLKIKAEEAKIWINVESLYTLTEVFVEIFIKKVDISKYKEKASKIVANFIEKGEKIFQNAIQTGTKKRIEMDIMIKAPLIIIPIDFHSFEHPALYIDFGTFKVVSLNAEINKQQYDKYQISSENSRMSSNTLSDQINGNKNWEVEGIIEPLAIDIVILIPKSTNTNDPRIKLSVMLEKLEMQISDKQLCLIYQILGNFMNFEKSYNNSLSPIDDNSEEENDLIERQAFKDVIKDMENIIEMAASADIKEINFRIIENSQIFTQFFINGIHYDIKTNPIGDVITNFYISKLSLRDMRPNIKFRDVISNPLYDILDCDEFAEEAEEVPQVKGMVHIIPKEDKLDVGFRINDVRIILSSSYVIFLYNFLMKNSELMTKHFDDSLRRSKNKEVYKTITHFHTRYTLFFSSVELWLPQNMSNSRSKIANIYLTFSSIYSSSVEIYSTYDILWRRVKRIYVWRDDEANVDFRQLGVLLGYADKTQMKPDRITRDLIAPTRMSVQFRLEKSTEKGTQLHTDFEIESLCIYFGFREVLFFTEWVTPWLAIDWDSSSSGSLEDPDKPFREIVNNSFSYVCSSLQLFLIEDTIENGHNLLHVQFSNMMACGERKSDLKLEFSTIVLINFYNTQIASWEPLVEEWRFAISMKKASINVPVEIEFISNEILNINLSSSLIDIFCIIKKRIYEKAEEWDKEQIIERNEDDNNGYIYEVKNLLGKEIWVWVDIPKNTDAWNIKNDESITFSQKYVNQVYSQLKGNSLTGTMLHTIQTPASIAISVAGLTTAHGILIEKFGMQAVTLHNSEKEVTILIRIQAAENKHEIIIESALRVINNTDFPITLNNSDQSKTVPELSSWPIPIDWLLSETRPYVNTSYTKAFIDTPTYFRAEEKANFVLEIYSYTTDSEGSLTVVEINPPLIVQNLMPCPIVLYANFDENKFNIPSGEEAKVYSLNPSREHQFKYDLLIDENTIYTTEWAEISENSSIPLIEVPKSKINAEISIKDFRSCEGLDLNDRHKVVPVLFRGVKNKLVQLFFNQIVLNKTDYDIKFSRLLIKNHSCGFYSSRKKHSKIKLANGGSWSNEFNEETIGIAGCIKLENTEELPKSLQFGIAISQAPAPLIKTRVISLVPRFIVSNYLGFRIHLRQYIKNESALSTLLIENGKSIPYQLEDSTKSVAVQVSETGELWSGPFSIENLEDFQIRFFSIRKYSDFEEGKAKKWWIPNKNNNYMHFVRVVIVSEDEATVHINFVTPKDPEFCIYNNTKENASVCQRKYKHLSIVIPPYTKIPWAYDNHLKEDKKVLVTINDISKKYSLEKVKEDKDLGEFKVDLVIEGITRQLNIIEPDQLISSEVNSVQENSVKKTFKFTANLTGVGLSIIDEKPSEVFYLSLEQMNFKIKRIEEFTPKRTEKTTKLNFKLGHLQIDNMSSHHGFFPVIFSPVQTNKDENGINIPFIQLKIQKFSSTKQRKKMTETFEKITWLELLIQSMQLKINEEMIFILLKIQEKIENKIKIKEIREIKGMEFMNKLYPKLSCECPVLSYHPSGIERKACFEFIRLCAIQIYVSFVKSHKAVVLGDPGKAFGLIGILNSVGSAFITISDSPLAFKELMLEYSFQTINNLMWIILKNYLRQAITQFYKIIGSSDLLGNPMGLIDKLGSGVFEFINEPAKGFIKGPKAFAQGVGKGFKSLVGNAVIGGFGSVSKITGSLYKVVKEVSGDPNAQNYKPRESQSLGKNMLEGFKGGVNDIKNGVTGVFTKPYHGAKEGGTGGFFKGLGSGVVGIVISPVAAILKFGNTLTGSVAHAATLVTKGKVQTFGRSRFPRHFGARFRLEPYNQELSQAQELLRSLNLSKKEKMVYYLHLDEEEDLIVILTTKNFLFLVEGEIIAKVKVEEIDKLEVHGFDNQFHLCIATHKKEFVLKSWSYGPIAKMYTAITSLPNSSLSKGNMVTVKVPNKYSRACF
ncbi:unnamed protein product [Blepharisma stoltei]|uniref:Vacuolar protein sorting-associated protein n=1 Tax=Blepharisma stoltei TaxID=1481888 RepID=A0AAU9IMJ6_9CILI|nr:unnamed protein product [Blepharisma stoltei]